MDQKTIDTYNEFAEDYDHETADFWEKFPKSFLSEFAKMTNSAKGCVLNVGSGPGRDGLLLKECGCDVTCLDASEAMVMLSTERGLRSTLGDYTNLPFADESFDGVWAYTSLLHTPKAEVPRAIAEIHRVLKQGGAFAIGLIEGEGESYKETSGVHGPRWFSFYTKPEVELLLAQTGFELAHFESFKPGSKKYLNFIYKKTA